MGRYSYPLLIIKNTHGYVAYIEGLDNVEVYGEGRTKAEAKTAVRKALRFHIESCHNNGEAVPPSTVAP